MQSPLSTGSPTAARSAYWLVRKHRIEPGLREPKLSTLTGDFDPPHIDRVPKAHGKIYWSGITAIEEYSIHRPEQQDVICSSALSFEHRQNDASSFLGR